MTGSAWNALTGALGGAIGGKINPGGGLPYSSNSRWLDPGSTKALNEQAAAAANTGLGNFARSVGAGFTGSIDPPGESYCK